MTATNKIKPGKRIKTWHRNAMKGVDDRDKKSLREFMRSLTSEHQKAIADSWLAGKASR